MGETVLQASVELELAEAARKLVNECPRTPTQAQFIAAFEPILERRVPSALEVKAGAIPPSAAAPQPGKVTLYHSHEDRTVIHRSELIEDFHGNKAPGVNMFPHQRLEELRRHLAELLPGTDGACVYEARSDRFKVTIGKFQVTIANDPCFPLYEMARHCQRAYDHYCDEQAIKRSIAITEDKDWVFWKGTQWKRDDVFRFSADRQRMEQYMQMLVKDFIDHNIVKSLVMAQGYCGIAHQRPDGSMKLIPARDFYAKPESV